MRTESVLFIDTMNELLESIEKAEKVIKELMLAPNIDQVVTEVSDTPNSVTILEPAILNVRMHQLTNLCSDIVLMSIVQDKDPKFELRTDEGVSWYELAKSTKLVSAIKTIRECFGPIRVDIKDAARIYTLIQKGLLKPTLN